MKLILDEVKGSPGATFAYIFEDGLSDLSYRGMQIKVPSLTVAADAIYLRQERVVFVSLDIRGEVIQECSRCLTQVLQPFHVKDGIEFREGFSAESVAVEPIYGYEGMEIDLSPHVESLVLSALDPQPLCQPDCRGLCPHCGANLNRDPQHDCPQVKNEEKDGQRTADPRLRKLEELLR